MELRLIREPTRDGTTMGVLFVDGRWFSFTCEDAIREVPGQPVSAWKVPRQTAIPAGRYRVMVTPSPRFGRVLPLVLDVEGFTGIRMHALNDIEETEGCIGPGFGRDDEAHPPRLLRSRAAEELLTERIQAAEVSGACWLTIENPSEGV